MLDIDSKILKTVLANYEAKIAQMIKDTIHPDDTERVILNAGYIANSAADIAALEQMLRDARYRERIERENAEA